MSTTPLIKKRTNVDYVDTSKSVDWNLKEIEKLNEIHFDELKERYKVKQSLLDKVMELAEQLVHETLEIPLNKCRGVVSYFIDDYGRYIPTTYMTELVEFCEGVNKYTSTSEGATND